MKKGVVVLLCTMIFLISVSCGQTMNSKGESGITADETLEEYSYVANYKTLSTDSNSHITCFCFQNDFLYYIKGTNLQENQNTLYTVCKRKLEESNTEEILFQIKSSVETGNIPTACAVFPDGRVILSLSGNQEGQNCKMLQLLKPDGEEIYTVDITDVLCGDFPSATVLKCVTDADENIFLLCQDRILVYEEGGTLLFSLPGKGEQILNMGADNDGNVLVTQRIGAGIEVSRINVKERSYSDTCQKFPENIRGRFLTAGGNNAVLMDDEEGLCVFKPEQQMCMELLEWADIGIEADLIKEIYMSESGTVFLFLREITDDGDICKLCALTRSLKSEMPVKQVVTIGTVNHSQLLEIAVSEFNRISPEYQIEILDYTQGLKNGNSGDFLDDAVQKLRLDIITGNAPDIIDFSQINLDHGQFMKKGFVEDLYSYIDSSEVLSREDLVGSVLDAYTTDGKLPCIPTAVYINTLAIKKSLVEDEMNWTPEDFFSLVKKQPADMQIMEWTTNMSILYVCMGYDESSYIDTVKGNCSLNSEEFKRILEFASSFPDNPQGNEESYSTAELLADHRLLLSQAYLKDITEIKKYYADFNGDLTFIGYPGRDGQGISAFSGLNALGISSQSQNKEGAWRFIQSLFTKEMQTNRYAWGIPVLQSVYHEKMEASMKAHYELDENGNEIEVANGPYAVFFNETYAVTEAEAEQFEELMQSIHKVAISSNGSQVYKIIEEEAAPYFAGQKSLEEVADIIQNRVQLYVSEEL